MIKRHFGGMEPKNHKKRSWEKPKILLLYRARPEESVLQVCKTFGRDDCRYTNPSNPNYGDYNEDPQLS